MNSTEHEEAMSAQTAANENLSFVLRRLTTDLTILGDAHQAGDMDLIAIVACDLEIGGQYVKHWIAEQTPVSMMLADENTWTTDLLKQFMVIHAASDTLFPFEKENPL